jgi:FlaA1/EpsC-like NDP-sugar epimerase
MNINKKTQVIIHDLFMSVLAWQFSWWVRYNFSFPFENWDKSLLVIPIVIIVQAIVFRRFHLYRGIWRFASIPDLWNIFRASIFGALFITLTCFILFRLEGIPRSIFILYPILLMFLLGGPRLTYRMWKDHSLNVSVIKQGKRVLIVGAGSAGDMLVRDMLREGSYQPVGFIDDNRKLINSEIHGIRVLGVIDDAAEICKEESVDLIIIAIPSATNQEMQKILKVCEEVSCELRTLPSMEDMVSGRVTLNQLREVMIEDLLGREKVKLDWKFLQKGISSKTVLVTGGGGSIGAELCKQIASLAPSSLVVFERSEFNLYRVEKALSQLNITCHFVLGDLCDKEKVEQTVAEHKPDIIFHAAAYKHVPILERQPREGIRNNIVGTKYIADAAHTNNCEKFVLISTDKAVNPTNILGATKRVAEIYTEIMNERSNTSFLTVRFGNVLDSEGSVVPLFKEQLKKGGPLTVTHKDVTRFFMTIPEACQLIMQASSMGEGGEIYVLDMGESVKINMLAEQLIKLSGLVPNKDIDIVYTGLRPGEKMYEELFYDSEVIEKTNHKKIHIAKHPAINLKDLDVKINEIINAINNFDDNNLIKLLSMLVPSVQESKDNVVPINKIKQYEKSN